MSSLQVGPGREIRRFRMMDDECYRGLLRHELETLGEAQIDAIARQHGEQDRVLFYIGACRIAPRVAFALTGLHAELFPDVPVDQFGEALGRLYREPVDVQRFGELARGMQARVAAGGL